METSFLAKFLSVIFTISGAVLFLVFGLCLNIFIFEISSKDLLNFHIPTLSKNDLFDITEFLSFSELHLKENTILPVVSKIFFNFSTLLMFWAQHIIMSNRNFKEFMQKFTHYHAYERGLYSLVSDVLSLLIVFLWQPITEITIVDFSQIGVIKKISLLLGLCSLVLFTSTLPFMMKIDLLGLKRMINLFIDEEEHKIKIFGEKVFIDPVYKLCRHPMQAGFIGMFLFSSCNYTLGRVLFIILMTAGILIGVHEEEKSLNQDLFYRKISKLVTNRFFPDFRNLFLREFDELESKSHKEN